MVGVSAETVLGVTRRGHLEVTSYTKGRELVTLVSCPLCGHEFDDHEPRWQHFLEEHEPEDAGLTPLRGEDDE